MSPLIVFCFVAMAAAAPSGFQTIAYSAPAAVVASPVSVSSQFHAQDTLGQYNYGYSAGNSAKAESKSYDGVTRGGYSYVDGSGVVQSANYVADDVNGFRVAATNLPKHVQATVHDTPEVVAAKYAHVGAYNEAAYAAAASPDVSESVVVSAPAITSYAAPAAVVSSVPTVSFVKQVPSKAFSYSTVAASPVVSKVAVAPAITSYSIQDQVAVAPAVSVVNNVVPAKSFSYSTVAGVPSVAVAPAAVSYSVAEQIPVISKVQSVPVAVSYSAPSSVVGVSTATSQQYHAQDALGQYTYGYSGGPSAKVETKTADGVTRGGYSYVDGNGLVQSARYIADDYNGFRVAATNLPVGVSPSVHGIAVSPVAVGHHQVVADTPEVAAAKAAHFAAHAAVKYHDYYDY